jgi:hypothetical protein
MEGEVQLKAGSAVVSMARMFLMDLEVRWLRVDFSSRFRYAQLLFLYTTAPLSLSMIITRLQLIITPIITHPRIVEAYP